MEDDDTLASESSTQDSEDEDEYSEGEDDRLLDDLYEGSIRGEVDLDEIMVSATHARRPKGINAEHLSKV